MGRPEPGGGRRRAGGSVEGAGDIGLPLAGGASVVCPTASLLAVRGQRPLGACRVEVMGTCVCVCVSTLFCCERGQRLGMPSSKAALFPKPTFPCRLTAAGRSNAIFS